MKAFKATLQTGLILLFLAFLPGHSSGQVYLTGLLQQGADSQTGHSLDSPIFTTEGGGETDFAVIYVTQPNAGYTAPFLNPGTSATASIDYALTPGNYEFYFFTVSLFGNAPGPANNPGTYGLNLFFDGDNIYPGIAAYSPANTLTATPVQARQYTLSLNGESGLDGSSEVPSPGSLTYVGDGLSVTLTDYGYGEPGVFGGPALDLVSPLGSVPDGYASAVGVFTLTVAPVPEPSPAAIFVAALSIFLIFKMKPAHGNKWLKIKLPPIIILLSAATFLSGCGAPCQHYNRLQVATFYGPGAHPVRKPYGTVIPFDTPNDVKRPYRVIGFMSCEGTVGEEGGILKAMLYRAADMGADGILLNASRISEENISPNNQKLNVNVTTGLIGEMIGNGNKRAFRAQAIQFTSTN